MVRVAERSQLSPAAFLAWEREQEAKHEYFDGEVYAMAGGSPRHNRLCNRLNAALENAVGRRGHVFTSDQRIRSQERRYVYPDVSFVCDTPSIEDGDVLCNPAIVVEVLSSTTEQYDRGLNWDGHQLLPSLTDYVLVSQDRAHVEHFSRTTARRWIYSAAGAGDRVQLSDGTILEVDAIFQGVFELPGDRALASAGFQRSLCLR
jgi:Uma2 family endonuclease